MRLTAHFCVVKNCHNQARSGFRKCISCIQGWTPEKREEHAKGMKEKAEREAREAAGEEE